MLIFPCAFMSMFTLRHKLSCP